MKQETEGEEKRMEAKAYLEQARNINIQIFAAAGHQGVIDTQPGAAERDA